MKARELRIGNYVLIDDKIETIDSIGIFGVNNHRDNYEEEWIDYERVQPIPITEEWLLKFGFEKTEIVNNIDGWVVNNFWISCYQNEPELYWLRHFQGPVNSKFKYVHQLQNLYFALTGEELQIKE